jgi:epoxyqueuosine reductase QueG
MKPDSNSVKQAATSLGADLCGIAPADTFSGAPKGHHPRDIVPKCKSVIVLACRFPLESMNGGPEIYTLVRNQMVKIMDVLAGALAKDLEPKGMLAVPKKSMGSCAWDESGRYRDTLSLKHAAVLAGLGKIGRNTLLINEKFGNMIWLSAVLTSLELRPDPPAAYEACIPGCKLCSKACPVSALATEFMEQQRCYDHAYSNDTGREMISCWKCRKACPRYLGIK